MKKWKRKLGILAAKWLDLPQDMVDDLSRVTLIGNAQMLVENHRGLLDFSTHSLKLQLVQGRLEVKGSELSLRSVLPDEVFVEGVIADVRYTKE